MIVTPFANLTDEELHRLVQQRADAYASPLLQEVLNRWNGQSYQAIQEEIEDKLEKEHANRPTTCQCCGADL